jgi:hypothetical protein
MCLALCVVQAATPAGAPAQTGTFDGSWVLQEQSRSIVERLDIRGTTVTGFIRCGEQLCDIGSVEGTVYLADRARSALERRRLRRLAAAGLVAQARLVATFETAFRRIAVHVSVPEGRGIERTVAVDVYSRDRDSAEGAFEDVGFKLRLVPTAGHLEHPLPQLEVPLPRPSLRRVLPAELVTSGPGDSLGAAFDRLEHALHRAEVPTWSVYGIGDDGFAVVSQAERIHDDGTGLAPDRRWPPALAEVDPPAPAGGFVDYLKRLFAGSEPGRYRLLIFAVTDRPLTAGPAPPSPATMDSLLVSGATYLPAALRGRTLGADGRCEVYIYEFVRPAADDDARLVVPSAITVARHLAGAGLWERQELGQ